VRHAECRLWSAERARLTFSRMSLALAVQLLDAAKDAAAQSIFGQVAEEAFDPVQPRAAGRREMHVKAGMAVEPALHPGMFVSGVVVTIIWICLSSGTT
jgi:hypothetical protein